MDSKVDLSKITRTYESQKKYFESGKTREISNRIETLKTLREIIKANEDRILEALKLDLNKAYFEGYTTEIGMAYDEINLHIKNLKKWSKRKTKKSPIIHFPAKSYIYKEPYGVTLIIGPFNYPFQLLIAPLIGAISAGNTVMLKPSEHTINIALLIEEIINKNFEEGLISVVNPLGGKETVEHLLELKLDYIFFTGSVPVGKIIMEKAAKNLIPVTLELGGKSPCIVDENSKVELAARRIVWGKFVNSGQTCVAPDYIFVHHSIKEKLLKAMVEEIKQQYGENAINSPDYSRLVNEKAVNRLIGYLDDGEIYYGGNYNIEQRYIEPTIMCNIKMDSKIMVEELFGPILPILEYKDINEVISYVNNNEKPLALYYFSESNKDIEKILKSISSGGVTINDTIIHVASSHLPFGGVGNSGMGAYHGKASFDTFTHEKSVIKRGTFIDISVRYAPYGEKINLIKKLMK